MRRSRLDKLAAILFAALLLPTAIALATPSFGIISAPVLARGSVADQFKLKLRNSSAPADTAVQQITIAPGGHTGWHTHPGPTIVAVAPGEGTLYDGIDGCPTHKYGANTGLF